MIKLRQRDGGKAPEPMLSPMIDMIFLLLVFLMMFICIFSVRVLWSLLSK